jgi:hypothetical protein
MHKSRSPKGRSDNFFEHCAPIAPGQAEFAPERLQNDLVQNLVFRWYLQINTATGMIVDEGFIVLIKEEQGAGVLDKSSRGPAGPGPSGIVLEYLVSVQLALIDGETEELTRPVIRLAWGIAYYQPAREIRRAEPEKGRGRGEGTVIVNSDSLRAACNREKVRSRPLQDIVGMESRSAVAIFRRLLLQE